MTRIFYTAATSYSAHRDNTINIIRKNAELIPKYRFLSYQMNRFEI